MSSSSVVDCCFVSFTEESSPAPVVFSLSKITDILDMVDLQTTFAAMSTEI